MNYWWWIKRRRAKQTPAEGPSGPAFLREDSGYILREDGSFMLRES